MEGIMITKGQCLRNVEKNMFHLPECIRGGRMKQNQQSSLGPDDEALEGHAKKFEFSVLQSLKSH